MTEQKSVVSKSKVEGYDNPVLFSSNGGNIWHIPKCDGDKVTSLCGRIKRSSVGISEYEFFMRRRNARQCNACKNKAEKLGNSGIEVRTHD